MTKYTKHVGTLALILLIGGALASPAFAAKGLDSSFTALSKSGTHQFYVWCTGKRDSSQSASRRKRQSRSSRTRAQSRRSLLACLAGIEITPK